MNAPRRAAEPPDTLVALDFDGTLAPIVDRPEDAVAHPEAAPALADLAEVGYHVAIVTGRPVGDVLRLGAGFGDIPGLIICGHYGLERWRDGVTASPEVHPGVEPARQAVTDLAAARDGVTIEDKGHSVAVHTRTAADPAETFAAVRPEVERIGERWRLEIVPGRYVLELRPAGVDKGGAVRDLVEQTGVSAVVFAGDDLGDLAAVAMIRALDVEGTVVCSDSAETPIELRETADRVVDGPAGVVALLRELAGRD